MAVQVKAINVSQNVQSARCAAAIQNSLFFINSSPYKIKKAQEIILRIKSDLTVTNGTTSNQNINYIRTGKLVTFTFNSIASNGTSTWEEVATLPINIPNDSVSSAILNNIGQTLGALIRVVGTKAYVLSITAGPVSGQVTTYTDS